MKLPLALLLVFMLAALCSVPVLSQEVDDPELEALAQAMQIEDAGQRITSLESFASSHPESKHLTGVLYLLAGLYDEQGNAQKQEEMWRKLVALDGNDAEALNGLAWLLASQKKDLDEAETLAGKAITILKKKTAKDKPSGYISDEEYQTYLKQAQGNVEDTYGFVYMQQEKFANALPHLERAAELNKEQPEIVGRLARAYWELNQKDKALATLAGLAGYPGSVYDDLRKQYQDYYIGHKGSDAGLQEDMARLREQALQNRRKALLGSRIDEPTPDFEIKLLDGTVVSKTSLAGKTVILNFWATWCKPCRLELPHFDKAYKALSGKDNVSFFAVSTDAGGPQEQVAQFIAKEGYSFPVALGETAAVGLGVSAVPSLLIINPEGKLIFRRSGYDGSVDLEQEFTWLLDAATESQ